MRHNSNIGHPYLPAREPAGTDVLQRAWRATLAGPADDPGGDTGQRQSVAEIGGEDDDPRSDGLQIGDPGLAGDPNGAALAKERLGGRPCRGRRTREVGLVGTADTPPSGDGGHSRRGRPATD